jgi:hypothetical protein
MTVLREAEKRLENKKDYDSMSSSESSWPYDTELKRNDHI